ncbi:MAG TPA: molybdopterin-binding protein, partial [Candidatus Thermoplasmatota archaeon]|nr:molybdopterin-binding protein [Candidatus Thermoplasmatota archaeon]
MDAVVLLLGNELLTGHTRDANGQHIASRLQALGHRVVRILVLPDDEDVVVHELTRAFALAPLVVSSGGLGPTHDDRTTGAVARFVRVPLVVDAAALRELLARYRAEAAEGRRPSPEATDASRKMVTVPAGAVVLPNSAGHAVGYVLDVGDEGRLVVLPGVPRELTAVWEEAEKVLPRGDIDAVVELDVMLPESLFAAPLEEVARTHAGLEVGSYPRAGEARVTVRFRGAD